MQTYLFLIFLACHKSCASCFGPNANQCFSCQNPMEVLDNYECSFRCLPGFVAVQGMCQSNLSYFWIECHKTCSECTTVAIDGCTLCEDSLFWGGQCFSDCPKGLYPDLNQTNCTSCPVGCSECSSATKCTECQIPFYRLEDDCVSECPKGTYKNNILWECSKCDSSCLSCYGPSYSECFECNYLIGYFMSSDECNLMTCSEGTYLNISETVQCLPCDSSCSTCEGGKYNCTACKENFKETLILPDNLTLCLPCSTGFTMSSGRKCTGKFT